MAKLLLVDDEPNVLYSLELALASDEVAVATARTGKEAIAVARRESPDAVILDVRLPDMSGLDLFDALRAIDSRLPAIIITAFTSTETAIEAMKRGAFEYLLKPVDMHQLHEVVARAIALQRMQRVPAQIDPVEDDPTADAIIGRCPAMQEVYKAIGRIAPQDVAVLIVGESGTGKELVARALYQHSQRAGKPFLAINCAAIPDTLLESELFGHEKGAFTGADRQRVGKFEQCHGGTILLDEVGDMAPATQAKMLRLLQQQQFERVGGGDTLRVDVRVIAATNRSLDDMVATGKFREDLLYRLNGFTIHLPALRDRKADIPLLVDHFLTVANRKTGKSVRAVAPEVRQLLEAHAWPGNVRELQSAIRFAVVQTIGDVMTPDCLPQAIRDCLGRDSAGDRSGGLRLEVAAFIQELLDKGDDEIYRKVSLAVDRVVLEMILRHVDWNQVHASELLGMSRTTLRAKLQSLGLSMSRQLTASPAGPT